MMKSSVTFRKSASYLMKTHHLITRAETLNEVLDQQCALFAEVLGDTCGNGVVVLRLLGLGRRLRCRILHSGRFSLLKKLAPGMVRLGRLMNARIGQLPILMVSMWSSNSRRKRWASKVLPAVKTKPRMRLPSQPSSIGFKPLF
jgi:hypothetical protein